MPALEFRPACPSDESAIADFNARLAAHGVEHRIAPLAAEGAGGKWSFDTIRAAPRGPITLTRYLCLVEGVVRGGVAVKELPFRARGADERIAFYGYPLSEGIVDPQWGMIGLLLQKNVTRQHRLVYGLGAGSADAPVAKLMIAAGWSCRAVPFRFLPLRATPFLRNLAFLRDRRRWRVPLDVLAVTRIGSVGLGGYRLANSLRSPARPDWTITSFDKWGEWADEVWHATRDRYALIGERSRATLSALYPAGHPVMRKLRFTDRAGRPRGWLVYSAAAVRGHKQFGDMRLGALIDMLAAPEDADGVASIAVAAARAAGADVVVANHAAPTWDRAFGRAGMVSGPTNSFLFLAPKLRERLGELRESDELFFTRGDGDGPVHLW